MTFSDDDLKRLKEKLPMVNLGDPLVLEKHQAIALLARLDAAEKCCTNAWNIEDIIEVPSELGLTSQSVLVREIDEFRESYKTWRKAAEK